MEYDMLKRVICFHMQFKNKLNTSGSEGFRLQCIHDKTVVAGVGAI